MWAQDLPTCTLAPGLGSWIRTAGWTGSPAGGRKDRGLPCRGQGIPSHHILEEETTAPQSSDAGSGPASQEREATLGPFSSIMGGYLSSSQADPRTPGPCPGCGACSHSQGPGTSLTCLLGDPWGLRLQWLARLYAYLLGVGLWEELSGLGDTAA